MKTSTHRGTSNLYHLDPSGKLVYLKDPKGNRLPDFSHVGYHSGERAIPHVPVKITLESSQGDDTQRIQDALDKLSTFPPDKVGFRGALLLKRGVYRVEGTLLRTVVLFSGATATARMAPSSLPPVTTTRNTSGR